MGNFLFFTNDFVTKPILCIITQGTAVLNELFSPQIYSSTVFFRPQNSVTINNWIRSLFWVTCKWMKASNRKERAI